MPEDQPTTIPAQLDREWKKSLGDRLTRQDELLEALTERMEEQETILGATRSDIQEVVEFFRNAKGAFNVFNMLGKLAKPIGTILGVVVAMLSIWTFWRNGGGR